MSDWKERITTTEESPPMEEPEITPSVFEEGLFETGTFE